MLFVFVILALINTALACSKDCASDEQVDVLVQTSNELGKQNALDCFVVTEKRPQPTIIGLSEGYILGITICADDETALNNSTGVLYVEPDYPVYIANP